MPKAYELKPNKTAFVSYRFIVRFIYSFIFFAFAFSILNIFIKGTILYFVTVFILLKMISYYSLSIQYHKEKYIFHSDKIIHESGGIFSNNETELIVRNITHVTMRLPFIEHKLYHTGTLRIESAGSGGSEIRLRSIENTQQMYEHVEKLMQYNGFKLSKSRIIQQEKPSIVGVTFEVIKFFFIGLIAIIFSGIYVISGLFALSKAYIPLGIAGMVLAVVLLIVKLIFTFLDLKNRTYDLYNDTITYEEGFLSKNYSFIPIENLSDSTLTQTFIDKVFELYDVKISCQGTNQEIHFKNIINGPKLESNIDNLINKAKSLVGTKEQKQATAKLHPTHTPKQQVESKFTAEFSMDAKRTIIPLVMVLPVAIIFFPLFLPWVIITISMVIKLGATRYLVKPKSMEERFNFISTKNKEFTNDKITAIVIKENFIDRWFNTCSIHFWSIGSAEDIKFLNIKKTPGLYEAIIAKSGIKPQQTLYNMNSGFKISEMLKAVLFLTILSALLILGSLITSIIITPLLIIPLFLIIMIYIAVFIYKPIYYKRSKLIFLKSYVYFTRGVFFNEYYYVLYDNIKDITTVKYPFSQRGSIRFNVAGEHLVQQGKEQRLISNHFKINYINDIDNKDELIDMIFYQRPNAQQITQIEQNIESYAPKPILESNPNLANSITGLMIASIIIFPLILLLPITIPLVIWSVKVKTFFIQSYRVVARSGIFYKKQISIVFNKIDHINFSQGMFNKMFHNGNITVNTTGSSRSELVITNIPNFKEFYEILKKYY